MRGEDINAIDSEAGVIASLIHNPELAFHSESLLPNHFTNEDNRYVYLAIVEMAKRGIKNVDAYNIIEILNSSEATRRGAERLSIDKLHELIDMSDLLARRSIEEYRVCANNVIDAAFRRDTFKKLKECQALCYNREEENVRERIYNTIDDVMTEFSVTNEIPEFKDVIDDCWEEIKSRQGAGYSGIPFKFPTLNEYVSIEKGELVVFAAEAKQGKSMFLLNCAIDLLKQDKSVLYLDSELNTRLFTARVLAHLSGIEYRRLVTGCYDKEESELIEKAMNWLKTRRFTHIYVPILELQSIYTAVKKVQHTQNGIDVLVVDYFKSSGDGDAWSTYAELGRFVDMVKNQIAGDMGIAAIGAAQATSSGKVADSAKIGRNASTICLIQDKTPEEVDADGVECGNKKLRVILNRNGMQMAPDEYIDLQFDGNHIMYSEAKQHTPQEPY